MSEPIPIDRTLEISLVNDLREIAGVAARIDEFCEGRSLPPQIAYAVNLAIDELLTNAITNGYGDDDPHRVEIVLREEADALVVIIVDDGVAFDPTEAPTPDGGGSLDDSSIDGLGFLLVRQMMDGVEYRRLQGCNIVTLTKRTEAGADTVPEPGTSPG